MSKNGRKRILFIRPNMSYGGADRVTLNLLRYLDREKYEPALALMKEEGELIGEVPEDVPVYNLNARSLWYMVGPLTQLLKKYDFDILYSICGGASIPLLMTPAALRKDKLVVVSERNILFPPHKSKIKRRFMIALKRYLYPRADYVTAVSKGVIEEIKEKLSIQPHKLKLVFNPIVTKELYRQMNEEVDDELFKGSNPVVLMVGRFVAQKNYPMMMRAFEKVAKVTKAKLFILGKGPLLGEIQTLAKTLGLEQRVVFKGYDKNPFKYMSRCQVFVLSSDHEGMPGVLIQAMACGAACISTDCPTGPSDLIEHKQNGILIKVGDTDALAASMIELINDREMVSRLGEKAKRSIDQFRFENGVNSYVSFLS